MVLMALFFILVQRKNKKHQNLFTKLRMQNHKFKQKKLKKNNFMWKWKRNYRVSHFNQAWIHVNSFSIAGKKCFAQYLLSSSCTRPSQLFSFNEISFAEHLRSIQVLNFLLCDKKHDFDLRQGSIRFSFLVNICNQSNISSYSIFSHHF